MPTRREVLLIGLGLEALAHASGEFWNDKTPGEWSDKEIERLLTKSPWAREASAEMNFSGMSAPDSGGRGGGMPGGRGGGPPMGGGGPGGPGGGMPNMKATVRWESAEPVREASKRQFPSDPQGSYVTAVSGSMPRGGAGRESAGRVPPQNMIQGLRETTVLQRKGGNAIAPVHIETASGDGTVLFDFPNDAGPISPHDKEVLFRTRMGPFELKVKFVPKEMRYRGKLAL